VAEDQTYQENKTAGQYIALGLGRRARFRLQFEMWTLLRGIDTGRKKAIYEL